MSDEIKQETQEVSQESTNVSQEETNKPQLDAVALQKELEKTRKEAASYRTKLRAKEEEEAAKKGEYETLWKKSEEEKKALEAEVSTFKTLQEEEFKSITSKWKEDEVTLIPSSLSISEKLQLAKKLESKLKTVSTPSIGTAGATGIRKGNYGGYSSKDEWATRDPKAYLDYVKAHGINF